MKNTAKCKKDKTDRHLFYRITRTKQLSFIGEGLLIGCAVCWLCYNDIRSLPFAGAISFFFFREAKKEYEGKQKKILLYHFKDFISALHAALQAGYSVENGVITAAEDVELLHGSSDLLCRELQRIAARLRVRIRIEDLFYELGERSDLDDIRMFAELLEVGKKTGGNVNQLLFRISDTLCGRIETKQEIDTQLSSKVLEQKIMSIMPACIIVYLRMTFPGFVETLYGNAFGACLMSVCLAVYTAAFLWGRKIVHIEVL